MKIKHQDSVNLQSTCKIETVKKSKTGLPWGVSVCIGAIERGIVRIAEYL